MEDPFQHKRIWSMGANDRLVRAFVADDSGRSFYPFTFPVSAIEGVVGISEASSSLMLRSGVKIPVALPYNDLEQKIYLPDFRMDDPVLDLCPVTGKAALAITAPSLARKFNAEVSADAKPGLKIIAFLRKHESNEFAQFEFNEGDIYSMDPFETSRSKCGKSLTIRFKDPKGPFGGKANLDMPHEDFISYLSWAKGNNYTSLDLCSAFKNNSSKYGLKPQ